MLSNQIESLQTTLLENKFHALLIDKSLQYNTFEYSRACGFVLTEFINSLKNEFNTNTNPNITHSDYCIFNNHISNTFNFNCNELKDCVVTRFQKESFAHANYISEFAKKIIFNYCSIVLNKPTNYNSIDFYKFKFITLFVKCFSYCKKNNDLNFCNNIFHLLTKINCNLNYNNDIFDVTFQIISNISNISDVNNKISVYNNFIDFLIPIYNNITITNNKTDSKNNNNQYDKNKIDFTNYTVIGLKDLCKQKNINCTTCRKRDDYIKLLSK